MPWWVFDITSFPSFNLGFSLGFWILIQIIPIVVIMHLIRDL